MSSSVPRNSALTFASQAFGAGLAFVCVPFLVRALGNEAFGLLSLLWMFVGYFGYLDLGIGQAAVKFLAESVAGSERGRSAHLIRKAASLSLLLGLLGGALMAAIAFIGIERFFTVSPSLQQEARSTLLILAACLPAILLQASLRSVPMVFNRFGLMGVVQSIGGMIQWGGAVAAVRFGGGLPSVVAVTVLSRYFVAVTYAVVAVRCLPEVLHRDLPHDGAAVKELLKFGGWVSVSQVSAPLLTFIERISIGALLSLSWVTFFAIPSEVVVRLLILPMSLVNALFPVMSGGWVSDEGKRSVTLVFQRSVKYLYLMVVPIVLFLGLLSRPILEIWVGADVAGHSATVLSLLALGYLFNALAQLPNAGLQALGRPDLPAKVAALEVPLYASLFILCTSLWGIVGSAIAWVLRVTCESAILFLMARRVMGSAASTFDLSYLWKSSVPLLAAAVLILLGRSSSLGPATELLVIGVAGIAYLVGSWFMAFSAEDRHLLMHHVLRSS